MTSSQHHLISRFLADESGGFHSVEFVLLGTVVCLGVIVGLAEYRNAVVQEYGDVSGAMAALDQSFSYTLAASSGGPAVLAAYSDTMVGSSANANGVTVNGASSIDTE